jgi:hypothetical protein
MKILIYVTSLLLILHFCQTAALLVLSFENDCTLMSCPTLPKKLAKHNEKPPCPASVRCDPSNCYYTASQKPELNTASSNCGKSDDVTPFLLTPHSAKVWQPPDSV